jgi:hypothetical protein
VRGVGGIIFGCTLLTLYDFFNAWGISGFGYRTDAYSHILIALLYFLHCFGIEGLGSATFT